MLNRSLIFFFWVQSTSLRCDLSQAYPFGVFDKVAPTGTLGNPLWKDATFNRLLRPLDDIGKLRIFREVVEISAVCT